MGELTPTQARLLELLDEIVLEERKARADALCDEVATLKKEVYALRRKLMTMTVQRDQWKESAARYRKSLLSTDSKV